jgi:hypothetical protein
MMQERPLGERAHFHYEVVNKARDGSDLAKINFFRVIRRLVDISGHKIGKMDEGNPRFIPALMVPGLKETFDIRGIVVKQERELFRPIIHIHEDIPEFRKGLGRTECFDDRLLVSSIASPTHHIQIDVDHDILERHGTVLRKLDTHISSQN